MKAKEIINVLQRDPEAYVIAQESPETGGYKWKIERCIETDEGFSIIFDYDDPID
jgi:hypothetical protein